MPQCGDTGLKKISNGAYQAAELGVTRTMHYRDPVAGLKDG
jgi:hypothetical protein